MILLALSAAHAEPFTVAGTDGDVKVLGWDLPPQEPAWVEEAAARDQPDAIEPTEVIVRCTLEAGPGLEPSIRACPAGFDEAAIQATRSWQLSSEGGTRFELSYVLRYHKVAGTLTMSVELDPGLERARKGAEGPPGVKLVHPAAVAQAQPARLPKGEAASTCRYVVAIDGTGRLADARVADCPQALQEPAAKALRKSRFTPRFVNGQALASELLVEVGFE